ncbi:MULTISPECIES: diacylglycerol kinase family protein [unclassified Parafrankia]|uniref:diacylglycerol/lipid kinase family protein n=1 Tax=unclassified Parafrankia TaxID=2994368 RepID=UPI000DA5A53D|nr:MULTISPECIES: diacylglycerol kinase family protein [unclassified Parafrankia]TCJ40301.1 diacylglycerol kinase [Parafrankia sp. BMG5.11]SQD98420.1 Diacylglycerol kinase catalytic region [Parafrankia sp. Ea1.12]
MRGLLVVNPVATTTTERVRDVLATALAADVALETVVTKGRGHGLELGARARELGIDVVIVLGGDGTVNEIVNGLVESGPAGEGPALAVVPGGSTNVFARALGYSASPVEATGELLAALREGRSRQVSVGRARYGDQTRYFTFCLGMGLDADVVAAVERRRDKGRRSTAGLFLRCATAELVRRVGRSGPAISITAAGGILGGVATGRAAPDGDAPDGDAADGDARDTEAGGAAGTGETGGAAVDHSEPGAQGREPVEVSLAIVCNTRPWTYLNNRPVAACPEASFDTGLDLVGLRRARLSSVLRTGLQMLGDEPTPRGRNVVTLHDAAAVTLRADQPVAVQMDGEVLGNFELVELTDHPRALRVIA